MRVEFGDVIISDDKNMLNLETVHHFLSNSYWASKRSKACIAKSIENSVCYGAYQGSKQIGFARVVTDDATMYWLADVYIDEAYRKQGIGQRFVECIVKSDRLKDLMGVLGTRDAHSLYEKYDYVRDGSRFMKRMPDYVRNQM